MLDYLDSFCRRIAQGLDAMTFEERQQLLCLLVERITVKDGQVKIETVIPPGETIDVLRLTRPPPSPPRTPVFVSSVVYP